MCGQKVASAFEPGDHGTTFGGNPFATAAGLAVFDILKRNILLKMQVRWVSILKKNLQNFKINIRIKLQMSEMQVFDWYSVGGQHSQDCI